MSQPFDTVSVFLDALTDVWKVAFEMSFVELVVPEPDVESSFLVFERERRFAEALAAAEHVLHESLLDSQFVVDTYFPELNCQLRKVVNLLQDVSSCSTERVLAALHLLDVAVCHCSSLFVIHGSLNRLGLLLWFVVAVVSVAAV